MRVTRVGVTRVGVMTYTSYVVGRPQSESGTTSGADFVPFLDRRLLTRELGFRQFSAIEPSPFAFVANIQLESKASRLLSRHFSLAMRAVPVRPITSGFARALLKQCGLPSQLFLGLALDGDVAA
jgi:hypothetical protein